MTVIESQWWSRRVYEEQRRLKTSAAHSCIYNLQNIYQELPHAGFFLHKDHSTGAIRRQHPRYRDAQNQCPHFRRPIGLCLAASRKEVRFFWRCGVKMCAGRVRLQEETSRRGAGASGCRPDTATISGVSPAAFGLSAASLAPHAKRHALWGRSCFSKLALDCPGLEL